MDTASTTIGRDCGARTSPVYCPGREPGPNAYLAPEPGPRDWPPPGMAPGPCSPLRPARTPVPGFADLARATVGSIEHDEFRFRIVERPGAPSGLALAIESDTRHHDVGPVPLDGDESPHVILRSALVMSMDAMADDARHRLRFRGIPMFAKGS